VRFAVDEQITFAEEAGQPYTVQAINGRFAILTRPMTAEDAEENDWPGDPSGEVMYTIVDSDTWLRGPNNLVLNCYDYKTREGCEECLCDLAGSRVEMSQRRGRSIPVRLVGLEDESEQSA
jgi:hypothetical protein